MLWPAGIKKLFVSHSLCTTRPQSNFKCCAILWWWVSDTIVHNCFVVSSCACDSVSLADFFYLLQPAEHLAISSRCAKWCRIRGFLLLTVTVVRALPALPTHSHTSKFFGASGVCAHIIIISTVPSLFSCYDMHRHICNKTKTHLVPWLTKSIHTRSTKYKDSSFATVVTLLALSRCCNVWCGSMAGIQSSRFQALPLSSNLKHWSKTMLGHWQKL